MFAVYRIASPLRYTAAKPPKGTGILMFTGIGLIAFGCIFGAASLGLFSWPLSERGATKRRDAQGGAKIDERHRRFSRRSTRQSSPPSLSAHFSVAVAVNLILDMEQPFAGFIRASAAPMRQALDEMK
jgi:hypothetical protein